MKISKRMLVNAGIVIFLAIAVVHADFVTVTIPTGSSPQAVAVDPVTNKIYVANVNSNNVTVIDGGTNTTSTVAADSSPQAVAVNPVTNKIYVANVNSNNVTVIDGATNGTTSVAVGSNPYALAVNPETNKIYVANTGGYSVTIIDGTTNVTTTVTVGISPRALAVNPVTNKIYVANMNSDNVTVIDGATNVTTTVAAGTKPYAVAVNPVTNKIYVANSYNGSGGNSVTVIDGATNGMTTVAVGINPQAVAVNSVTNRIYVANFDINNITIVDGATNSATTVAAGAYSYAVAVNPVTNKIYVANASSNNVTVIDGATDSMTTVGTGTGSYALAVNPVTNKIYMANTSDNKVTIIDGATSRMTAVGVGSRPQAVVVNPVTNKIYVMNWWSNNITVINGATNSTNTVGTGSSPYAIATNPVTNKIYVANNGSDNVTVIDGVTNGTTTVATGSIPYAVAVNPVTNKIYVVNYGSNNVTVIDGPTNGTTTVVAGSFPRAVAVNPVTNKIYVVNSNSANVTVIDGVTNGTTTVGAGTNPYAVAVNPVTNKIYVANAGSNNVTVIDGTTNGTTTVVAGTSPRALAVNPVTNKIYVANWTSWTVTVINGATNDTARVATGINPCAVAVNPVTNKIYVTNSGGSDDVSVIDGISNGTTSLSVGTQPEAVAVNPVTNRIYVANFSSANVTVIEDAPVSDTKLLAIMDSLPNDTTTLARPTLIGKAVNRQRPGHTGIWSVQNNMNTCQSSWNQASITSNAGSDSVGWSWNWGTDSLIMGENFLCVVAFDSLAATTNNFGLGTPYAGNIAVYPVYRFTPPPATAPLLIAPPDMSVGQPLSTTFSWSIVANTSFYTLQVSTDSLFSSFVFNGTVTAVTQAVSGLSSNTTYYWRVNAGNIGGVSAWSSVWSFSTIAAPQTPTLVLPTNGDTNQPVFLSFVWNMVSTATSYHVQVSTDIGFASIFSEDSSLADSIKPMSGLANSTTYYWRVRAKNTGGVSNWTTPWSFTTIIAPIGTPTLVSPASSAINQPISLSLIWNTVSTATSYYVQVATDTGFTSLFTQDSSLTDSLKPISSLVNSTVYYWRVRAKNAGGSSNWTSRWSFTTIIAAPATPTLVSPANGALAQPVSLSLVWNKISMATSYYVQVATDTGFTSLFTQDSTLADSLKPISGLSNSTVYYWRVRAKNIGGVSAWTSRWSFTTIIAAPSAPTLVSPANGDTNVPITPTLKWSKISTATSYHVQVATDTGFTSIFTQDSTLTDTVKVIVLDSTTTYYWRVRAKNAGGISAWSEVRNFMTGTTAVLPYNSSRPSTFSITGSAGTVRYALPMQCRVSLKFYDLRGRLVASLVNTTQTPGYYAISVRNALPSHGLYVRVFEAGTYIKRELTAIVGK